MPVGTGSGSQRWWFATGEDLNEAAYEQIN
jgi:hypothetical protein